MLIRSRALALVLLALISSHAAAAGRELAPRLDSPTTYATLAPVTAFSNGRFLTIWREDRGALGSPLVGALSDANGRRITQRTFTLDLPLIANPWSMRLIATGNGFTLFWYDYVAGTFMARLDANGGVLDVRRVQLPGYTTAEFAWNGTHYAAVMQLSAHYDGVAAIFDSEGTIVAGNITLPFAVYGFEIVVANGEFVAVTVGWDGIFVTTIDEEGIGTHKTIERTGPGRNAQTYRVAFPVAMTMPNGDVLILWRGADDRSSETKAIVFRRDGTLSTPNVLAQNATTVPLAVARLGDQIVATFISANVQYAAHGDLFAMRLDAAGAPLEEPQRIGGTRDALTRTAVSDNVILVVHQVQLEGIVSIAIGPDATPREPEILSIHVSRQHQPALGTSGGTAVAVWTELAGQAAAVRAAATNANGEPFARSHVALAQLASRDLAWSGTYFLAVHRDTTKLMASRINADGRAIDEEPIVLSEYLRPASSFGAWSDDASVVWAGTHWLVAWSDKDRLRYVRVSNGGVPTAPRTLQVLPPLQEPYVDRDVTPPALAFDGERVLLVFSDMQYEPCWMMPPCPSSDPKGYGVLLTRDGEALNGSAVELPIPASGFFDPRVSIASSGSEFMLVNMTRAYVVRADGDRLRHTHSFDFAPTRYGATDVTWDGRDYVIAHRFLAGEWYLAIHRLNRDAVPVATPRGVKTLPPDLFAAPSIAVPIAGDALVAVQEGTADEGVRAVIYREAEMSPLPPPSGKRRSVR